MRKSEEKDGGEHLSVEDEQCKEIMKLYGGYLPFSYKAHIVEENLPKMPLHSDKKDLIKKWIKQQHCDFLDYAFDYALQIKNGQQHSLNGKLSLYRLNKSFKQYEKSQIGKNQKGMEIEM